MHEVEIKMNSVLQSEALCRVLVAAFLLPHGISEEDLLEVKTIVSEGVCNAIFHGSQSEQDQFILSLKLEGNELSITIQDFGKGIDDLELARTPMYTTKAEDERSGLGFTIMETFSDELRVENIKDHGVILHLRKVLTFHGE